MKIAISSKGEKLESNIDSRFGRCQCFVIVDTGTMEIEVFSNENSSIMGGAGIRTAKFVADLNVKAILTGNVGPNAFDTLDAAGIEILTGVEGTVKDAIEQYMEGNLNKAKTSTVGAHFGLGKGR